MDQPGNETQLVKPPEKMSLWDHMQYLLESESQDFNAAIAEVEAVNEARQLKVDNYKSLLERAEEFDAAVGGLLTQMDAKIKKVREAKATMIAFSERLEKLMVEAMRAGQLDQLPGNQWIVKLVQQADAKIKDALGDPNSESFRMFPGMVRRKYEWDRKALIAAIKANPSEMKDFGEPSTRRYLRWNIKKIEGVKRNDKSGKRSKAERAGGGPAETGNAIGPGEGQGPVSDGTVGSDATGQNGADSTDGVR